MSKAHTLYEVFSRPTYRADYARAKAQRTCIICSRSAVKFKDPSARLEYTISGLCQRCQDQMFSSGKRGERA